MLTPAGWPMHFTLRELTRSARADAKGIANDPSPEHEASLRALAWHILVPLRQQFGPIAITSGYRSAKLNAATPGASKTSQHALGQAVDMDVKALAKPTTTNAALFHYIRQNLPFDQLISEFPSVSGEPKWVHVSFSMTKRRESVLVAMSKGGKTVYAPWSK